MAASIAVPPRSKASAPAAVAAVCGVAIAQFVPSARKLIGSVSHLGADPVVARMPGMIRRVAVVAVVLLASSWPVAASAQAQAQGHARDQVVLSGDVTVVRGTVVHEVVVFSGSATVEGVVEGDVVVLRGPITVSGQVGGDVIALHGPIHLLDTAQVGGDV